MFADSPFSTTPFSTAVAIAVSLTLSAESGSYVLTGTNQTFQQAVPADSGLYDSIGSVVNLKKGIAFSSDASSYTYLGTDATIAKGYLLAVDVGATTTQGTDTILLPSRNIVCNSSMVVISGSIAILSKTSTTTTHMYMGYKRCGQRGMTDLGVW